ncbi:MAG TPA: hypothetical protein VHJ78_03255 [Actinomycetota bacterium]|nr:hypothetical protein [Actinomycetota bacterium]
MVVRVNGRVAGNRRAPSWPAWIGPLAVFGLWIAGNLLAGYYQAWGYAPGAVAAIHTAGFAVMAWPFLRLVRDVEIGRFGIEAHFYRGTTRYLRFYEIASVSVERHAVLPSRIRIEDVYGRTLYLRGDWDLLAMVSSALSRST